MSGLRKYFRVTESPHAENKMPLWNVRLGCSIKLQSKFEQLSNFELLEKLPGGGGVRLDRQISDLEKVIPSTGHSGL